MIPEIRKILYSTDLSPNARHAFSYAASIANRYGAGITILHVMEEPSQFSDSLVVNILGGNRWGELRKAHELRVLETVKQRLEAFCEETAEELPSCPFLTDDIIIRIGNPVEEIVRIASGDEFDLVVIGAHGHEGLTDAMMGSTAARVLRRCRTPVLLVRLPEN